MKTQAMWLQQIAKIYAKKAHVGGAGPEDPKTSPKQVFARKLRENSVAHRQRHQENTQDTERRSEIGGGKENQILGGSDPILTGLAAAQRLSAPGVATAQVIQQTSSLRRRQICRRSSQEI